MSDNWKLSLKYECCLINEQDEILLEIISELVRNLPYLSMLPYTNFDEYEKGVDKRT